LKIGQYLMKLCVDYVGLLFLAHPVGAEERERVGRGGGQKWEETEEEGYIEIGSH